MAIDWAALEAKGNPFTPGPGLMPPALAGREAEQADIAASLNIMSNGRAVAPVMMYGPRGMGKTVLMNWVGDECLRWGREDGKAFSVIKANAPKMLASKEAALKTLSRDQRLLGQIETTLKGSLPQVASAERRSTELLVDRRWEDLDDALKAACQATPMVLLLDEAHAVKHIDEHVYQQFLGVVQAVIGEAPFLLVLAGTPDLPSALNPVDATFISRARQMGIGLLDADGAAEAIRRPLEESGIEIGKDALAAAVEDGQRYPYFLQLWGEALWRQATGERRGKLAMQDLRAAGAKADKEKLKFYRGRYEEVADDELTKAAAYAVADAFSHAEVRNEDQLQDAVQRALSPLLPQGEEAPRAKEQFKKLRHLGFVWQDPDGDDIRPGIPSLMDYTLDRKARAARR